MNLNIPYMETDNKLLNDAYRIAAGDIVGNIVYYQNGLLTEEKALYDRRAGLQYPVDSGYGNQHLERVVAFCLRRFPKTRCLRFWRKKRETFISAASIGIRSSG